MEKLKSNPYVYPYVPFYNLGDKRFRAKFMNGGRISFLQLRKFVRGINNLKIKHKGKSVEEKIFNVFLEKDVLFGPKEYVLQDKKNWLLAFKRFIYKLVSNNY